MLPAEKIKNKLEKMGCFSKKENSENHEQIYIQQIQLIQLARIRWSVRSVYGPWITTLRVVLNLWSESFKELSEYDHYICLSRNFSPYFYDKAHDSNQTTIKHEYFEWNNQLLELYIPVYNTIHCSIRISTTVLLLYEMSKTDIWTKGRFTTIIFFGYCVVDMKLVRIRWPYLMMR